MELGEALLAVGTGERAASFDIFSDTLDAAWITAALTATGPATIRRRKLPAEYVVWLIIGMGLLRDRSIREVVRHLDLVLPARPRRATVSGGAIVQARDRLGPAPLEALFAQSAAVWAAAADAERWHGLAIYGVDGRELRAFLVGSSIVATLCVLSVMLLTWLARGFGVLCASISRSPESSFFHPDVSPILSPYRLDAASFLGRLIGWPPGMPQELAVTAVVVAMASWACWRVAASARERSGAFSAGLICVTLLTCMYHQVYDAVVLVAPMIALATSRWQLPEQPARPATRWILFALLALPVLNFLNTDPGLRLLGDGTVARRVADSVNSIGVLAAFLVYLRLASHHGPRPETSRR